jgi:hypothetical protein
MEWIFIDLLTRMFDLQSSNFPFVTLYALCDLPLGLTRNSASNGGRVLKITPGCKYISCDPCQLRLPVTDQCNTNTAEERRANHHRSTQGKIMRDRNSLNAA